MEAKKSGKPTPTPWTHRAGHGKHHAARWILSGDVYVAKTYGHEGEDAEANAQRIVAAVNAHEELLAQAKNFLDYMRDADEGEAFIKSIGIEAAIARAEARP